MVNVCSFKLNSGRFFEPFTGQCGLTSLSELLEKTHKFQKISQSNTISFYAFLDLFCHESELGADVVVLVDEIKGGL